MHWGFGWGYWPHMWFGGMFMLVFWIAVIIGVIFFVKYLTRNAADRQGSGETSLDILKKRYARGEITKEEFDRIKQDLQD